MAKRRKANACRDKKGRFVPVPQCTGKRARRKKKR